MGNWLLRNGLTLVVLVAYTRLVERPRVGQLGLIELFLINAVGDLASHSVFEAQHPLLPGLASVIFWVSALMGANYLAQRWPAFQRYYYGTPHRLAEDGALDRRTAGRQGVRPDEVDLELRAHGVRSISEVKSLTLEVDGTLSVVKAADCARDLRRMAEALSALAKRVEGGAGRPE